MTALHTFENKSMLIRNRRRTMVSGRASLRLWDFGRIMPIGQKIFLHVMRMSSCIMLLNVEGFSINCSYMFLTRLYEKRQLNHLFPDIFCKLLFHVLIVIFDWHEIINLWRSSTKQNLLSHSKCVGDRCQECSGCYFYPHPIRLHRPVKSCHRIEHGLN